MMSPFTTLILLYLAIIIGGFLLWQAHRTVRRLSATVDALIGHQDLMKHRGIYMIECMVNRMTYVGSTKVNFHSRWGQHIAALTRDTHDNPRLQFDWNLHSPRAFVFSVVEVIDDPDLIEKREREILAHRALHILPVANYNVNNSRVFAVPSAPELDPAPVVPTAAPARRRRSRRHGTTLTEEEYAALIRDLDLPDGGIAALQALRDADRGSEEERSE